MTEYANNRLNEVLPLLEKAVTDAFDDGYSAARMQIRSERANVRGKWIENRSGDCVCQRCGYEALWFYGGKQCKSDFCPNCGADMRGINDV